ncbi:MAG: CBS domain-containing protein [Hyphomicrobium sp.]
MNVATILKTKGTAVTTARPDQALLEIIQKLSQKKIGAIVVVGDKGSVDGIISERDVIKAISHQGEKALTSPVSQFMTRKVVTCQLSSHVDELMELMTAGRFRHLPVVENGSLLGIVSIGDIVRNHVSEVELEVSAMRNYLATG